MSPARTARTAALAAALFALSLPGCRQAAVETEAAAQRAAAKALAERSARQAARQRAERAAAAGTGARRQGVAERVGRDLTERGMEAVLEPVIAGDGRKERARKATAR